MNTFDGGAGLAPCLTTWLFRPQVFICGPSPHWMLVTSRGALRLHPMSIDGPIESFSPFHNINCPKGFLYFNKQVGGKQGGVPTERLPQAWWWW